MTRREKIKAALMNIGVDPSLKGFDYLVEAIDIVIEHKLNKKDLQWIELYEKIALPYNTTRSRTERAMRHAIEKAFDTPYELIHDVFGPLLNYYKSKPTNSTFIAVMAERIIMDKFVFMEVVENGIK